MAGVSTVFKRVVTVGVRTSVGVVLSACLGVGLVSAEALHRSAKPSQSLAKALQASLEAPQALTEASNTSAELPNTAAQVPQLEIAEFLPEGRVSSLESVQVRFAQAAVAFGDPRSVAPFKLECEGPVPAGQGRWLDDKRWTYVFEAPVPAGVKCVAHVEPELRSPEGHALPSGLKYAFDTGAPSVMDVRPFQGWDINEDQVFILQFDAPISSAEVAAHSHCAIKGVGEMIPTRALSDGDREAFLKAAYMTEVKDPARIALLQCTRSLPPEGKVRVEVGPGVRALGQAVDLEGSDAPYVAQYDVRAGFTAKLSCTRERAGRPCLPITPIFLNFSAAITPDAARQVTLKAGDQVFEAAPPDDDTNVVTSVKFPGPFPAGASLTLTLPAGLQDDAGRQLENAANFPLKVQVSDYPPLAKFASGTFGVIERFANRAPAGQGSEPGAHDTPMVPVTVRNIEARPAMQMRSRSAGSVAGLHVVDDLDVLQWYARLQRLDDASWTKAQLADIMASREPRPVKDNKSQIDTRGFSVLKGRKDIRKLELPGDVQGGTRPFEVIGVPVEQPGFHVLELESARLGHSLLESGGSMFVRTGVLVTNLSVHAKRGTDDLLVWVTTLADASVVEGAKVNVLDCRGTPLASGHTDAQGIWHHRAPIAAPDYCEDTGQSGLFISARIEANHPLAHAAADYAFVLTGWDRGIESWRFNVPTAWTGEPEVLAHTVLDRSLYRAGETVGMKHFVRLLQREGLGIPEDQRPTRLIIEHAGSSQRYELPVVWQQTASGGLAAVSEFEMPDTARLGTYSLRLTDEDDRWYGSTEFRVEEFRLPTFVGRVTVNDADASRVLVAPRGLDVSVQLSWMTGGPAAGQDIALSALVEDHPVSDADDEGFSFQAPPRVLVREFFPEALNTPPATDERATPETDEAEDQEGEGTPIAARLFVDHKEGKLDEHGGASLRIDTVPPVDRPSRIRVETSYTDPIGEVHTLSSTVDVWPGSVQAGIKTEGWDRAEKDIPVMLKAVGPDLKPRAGVPMTLQLIERQLHTVRKRMVGGFYRYESHTTRERVGQVCEGVTDARGVLACSIRVERPGSYELVAVANDEADRQSLAYATIWASGAGELWFGGQDDDRIDLIPARRQWAAGEEAEFQVRMPFREATALVTVEREGVLWTDLQHLQGRDPLVRVPVSDAWGPNAYVSVLLLRGRLYQSPALSFFDGGWRDPAQWLKSMADSNDPAMVTQQIDLAKPAMRMGLSELKVTSGADQLKVEVAPTRDTFNIREEAVVKLRVTLPDGRPAAGGSVAFAVVDEALLELSPNRSWDIYDAMHPRRSLAVQTATSQLQVVGRRHYGRKAIAAGGGGGLMPTRELFDTLLSWQPMVTLDEQGEAEVRFRPNDALTRFRLVAVADYGSAYFGQGQSSVATRQDIQLVTGLPPTVREGDRYEATVTVRNGTEREREIQALAWVGAAASMQQLEPQSMTLKPGEARAMSWPVTVPDLEWPKERGELRWRFEARDEEVGDRLELTQRVEARVPVSTVQATLVPLSAGASRDIPLKAPAAAGRDSQGRIYGGLLVDVASTLAGNLQGVEEWWRRYPYSCLEQTSSRAIALRDADRWRAISHRLGNYLDDDGLLRYFPGTGPGSAVLTAYVVAITHEARELGYPFELLNEHLETMLDGLQAFIEGRIRRDSAVREHADELRLMVMEALSRYGRLQPDMLSTLKGRAQSWSTPAVVDWLSIVSRLPSSKESQVAQKTARNILRGRMLASGTTMAFTADPINAAAYLMATPVTSLSRLISVVMDHPAWQDDLPLMAQGLLAAQTAGAWRITTENVMAPLALERFSRRFEAEPVLGTVSVRAEHEDPQRIPVPSSEETRSIQIAWPSQSDVLALSHEGQGRAWLGLRAQARVEPSMTDASGYRINRQVQAVHRKQPDTWSPGDIYRVEIEIESRDGASWVVLNDPVPSGATILGSELGRDMANPASSVSAASNDYPPSFVERAGHEYRAYFQYLPAGRVKLAYAVRLNSPGEFGLPPTRVEALYQPGVYGVQPNPAMTVVAPNHE